MVSHQLQYIKNCDQVVLLEKGTITGSGSFESVMSAENSSFAVIMREFKSDAIEQMMDQEEEEEDIELIQHSNKDLDKESATQSTQVDTNKRKEISQEKQQTGNVTASIYIQFFQAGLPFIFLILLILAAIVGEALLISTIYWLSLWTQQSPQTQQDNLYRNIYIFVGLVLVCLAVAIGRALWFYMLCLRSTRRLFISMLKSVFRAPMDFFHTNPHGRIMK